jgi:hypothetical protein
VRDPCKSQNDISRKTSVLRLFIPDEIDEIGL